MGKYEKSSKNEAIQMINVDDIDFNCVPISVSEDVKCRIADWLASGGKPDDPYVQRQLQYIKNVERAVKSEMKKKGKCDNGENK